MNNAVKVLTDLEIPVNSLGLAAPAINKLSERLGDIEKLSSALKDMTGQLFELPQDYDLARFTFAYMVQNIVKVHKGTWGEEDVTFDQLFASAQQQATTFIAANQYLFVECDEEQTVVDETTGQVTTTKRTKRKGGKRDGSKLEKAQSVFDQHFPDKSRKEIIQLLVTEVDLTPAGASTYYQNMKKKALQSVA